MAILLLLLVAVVAGTPVFRDPMINEGLFEGDIMGIDPNADRNAVPRDSQRWPGAIVPYIIIPEQAGLKDLIDKAMRHIESKTCIRFRERTFEKDYVRIMKGGGCYAYLGRIGGQQDLSLGVGCENFAIVVHEMLHAIGFEHEHNRSDRDDYLIINWQNIDPKNQPSFRKLRPDQNRLLVDFDINSIMMYGSRSFAKDYWSDNYSMVTKDGKFIEENYKKTSMSDSDAKRINILYNCGTA